MFCCVVKVCTFVFSKHTHSWGGGGGSINTSEASQERVKETGLYFVILLLYFVNHTFVFHLFCALQTCCCCWSWCVFRSVTSHVKPQRGCHGDLYVDLYTPRVKVKPSVIIRVVRETLQQEYMRNSSLYEEDVVYFINLTQTPL